MLPKKLCIIFILFPFMLLASNETDPVGARSAAMGRSGVAMPGFWSVHRNQAGMAYIKNISAGVYYENRFMVKELGLKAGAFILPTKAGVMGISVSQFGYQNYNENKFGIAYANKFGEKIAAGLQLDYMHTFIAEDYGNKGLVTFEAGMIAELTQNLLFGVHIFNPIQASIAKYNDESLPAKLTIGGSYSFSEKIILNVDAEKELENDLDLKTGLEYHIVKPVYVRAGISTNPSLNTFGFGLEYKKLKFDFASSLHSVLGYSPQFSLVYGF